MGLSRKRLCRPKSDLLPSQLLTLVCLTTCVCCLHLPHVYSLLSFIDQPTHEFYRLIACAIPFSEYIDPFFHEILATFLEQVSIGSIKLFSARATKAELSVVEVCNTIDLAIVTQMLMTLQEAKGCRVFPPVLCRRVRNDVCWNYAYMPWRQ